MITCFEVRANELSGWSWNSNPCTSGIVTVNTAVSAIVTPYASVRAQIRAVPGGYSVTICPDRRSIRTMCGSNVPY